MMAASDVRNWLSRRGHFWPCGTAILMAIAGLAPLDFSYYMFVRWFFCAFALWTAIAARLYGRTWAAWLFGVVCMLFNPLLPLRFPTMAWRLAELAAAGLFLLAILTIHRPAAQAAQGLRP